VPDPIAEFESLFARAKASEPGDATAMALATATRDGRPAVRMVLLKGVDSRGFAFYTNLGSRKARELAANPHAALCIHWPVMQEQVRVEGTVEPVSAAAADAYFASRPRGSRLGAWLSHQSQPLSSRFALLRSYVGFQARFAGREIPRPDFWGGYLLSPTRMEFWSSKPHRLHDRREFTREDGVWTMRRLYP
jgi:pyridoxamine 5'-phosphate oxidase